MIMAGIDATDPEQIVRRSQNLILRLMDELDASTSNAENIEELIDIHIEDARDKAAMMKAVSLSGRAGVINALRVTDLPGQPPFGEVCAQWFSHTAGPIHLRQHSEDAGHRHKLALDI